MHFEFLVEDQSGAEALKILASKLLEDNNTCRVHHYRGLGHPPKGLKPKTDANKRILLDRLPQILKGYGRIPNVGYIVIICDLDDKDKKIFLKELNNILNSCSPKPDACFCLAIEEIEAWYLGDLEAIRKAYPSAKKAVLNGYVNDSICGTWELLADATYKGGYKALSKKGRQAIGIQKFEWANMISPYMDISNNKSPSFMYFCSKVHDII
jgi:hypothetical protein